MEFVIKMEDIIRQAVTMMMEIAVLKHVIILSVESIDLNVKTQWY